MKKRVISFLLSISMLVAAVPATAISSAAADSITTIRALDIFKTNKDGNIILAPNIVAAPKEDLTILHAAAILVGVMRPTIKVESKNAIGLTDKTRGIYERAVGMGIFSETAKTNVNARLSAKGVYTVLDRTFEFTELRKKLIKSIDPETLQSAVTVEDFIGAVDILAGTILNGKGVYKIDKFDTDNVTITKPGITLAGATIEENLTIADGVGDGDVSLVDVTVKGDIVSRMNGRDTSFEASVLYGTDVAYCRTLSEAIETVNKLDSKKASDLFLTLYCDVTMTTGFTITKPMTINGNGGKDASKKHKLTVRNGINVSDATCAILVKSNDVIIKNLDVEITGATPNKKVEIFVEKGLTGVQIIDDTF